MRYIFKFPDIGEGIQEGKILQWYVRKGQAISSGDSLVKVETDKVVTDMPSPRGGTVAAVFGKEGEVIKVGDPLVEIDIAGVDAAAAQEIAREKPVIKSQSAVEEKSFGVVGTLEVAGDAARLAASSEGIEKPESVPAAPRKILATPVARAMARDMGIDINLVRGTGPAGRVTKEDIRKFTAGFQQEAGPAAKLELPTQPEVEIVQISQIRKTIARNMAASKQNAAHMTVFEEAEISELIRIRNQYKDGFLQKATKLTYLPFILKAAARALHGHPWLNSQLNMDKGQIIIKKYYNLGIAVDTDEGLVVPVIRQVDQKSVMQLAGEIQVLKEKARNRTLSLEDIRNGTFTVTNYGSLGGTYGVPVINYPQVAILGVGRIMKIPIVRGDQIAIGQVLPLSLTVDHRIIDGGAASRFIIDFIHYLQDPISMCLE